MYTLSKLTQATAVKYWGLTFPSFQSKLEKLTPQGLAIAIGAEFLNRPVGLVLAEVDLSRRTAEVLSLLVLEPYQGMGIGTSLLTNLEQELFQQDCTDVHIVYMTGEPTIAVLEHLLKKLHWSAPIPRQLVCRCDRRMLEAPWLYKYQLPAEFEVFPWLKMTPEERLAIQRQQEVEPWISPDLVPFNHEQDLEPLNSLGLRYKGQVVGWLIAHRLTPDTIRYTCGFVRTDLQKMGRLICLLAEAIKLQAAKPEIPNAVWAVSFVRNEMIQFVQRRMVPYGVSMEETRGAFKTLVSTFSLKSSQERLAPSFCSLPLNL